MPLKTNMRGLLCLISMIALLIVSSACRQASGGAPTTGSPCEVALAARSGDAELDREIARIQQEIRSNAKPFQTTAMIEKLGWSFVEKARESFDPGFYKLAEQCALCLESKQGQSQSTGQSDAQPLSTPRSIRSAALLLRGHALHNMHRFSEAEKIARELVEARGLAYDFGLLGDALIEQGKTDEAALAYQKMMEIRPGPQAYGRAASLRWLKGDTNGARALMLMSAQAAGQTESAAWAWSKLTIYELQAGEIKRAHSACDAALMARPDYAPALLALGRVLLAENKTGEAVAALERAARLNPLPEYQWALADALSAAKRDDDAANVERRLAETRQANDPRSYSLFLATRGRDPDVALRLAEEEMKVRRDIYTLDALAWAQSAKGAAAEAWKTMRSALALGTEDARLYLHAAEISKQAGEPAQAKIYAAKAAKFAFSLLPCERIWLKRLNLV
ncbi:MAG TPA: tetratricopeptide repeat protein [Blastocatellia bacterium]|nr:tetratricopeptide repeat protein [Blastocatellia bacterium]